MIWNPTAARNAGGSLVEVMMAILILAALALASGAFMHRSRAEIAQQKHRRVALELANARLEDVRASRFAEVASPATNYTLYYLRKVSNSWSRTSFDPGEIVTNNLRRFSIRTTVQYKDVDGGLPSYDYLDVVVSLKSRPGGPWDVTMESFYSRW